MTKSKRLIGLIALSTGLAAGMALAGGGDAIAPVAEVAPSVPAPGPDAAARASVTPPATLTITTGGGHEIEHRFVALFSKTKWRLRYPDAPALEKVANDLLAADGYNVEFPQRGLGMGWDVMTVAIGDPANYAPAGDGKEEAKAGIERGSRIVLGVVAGVLSGGNANVTQAVATGPTINSPNAKYLTRETLSAVPPGAKKILVTRVSNSLYRAQQEVITLAYTDISDDELRHINFEPILEMTEIKKK